MPARTIEISRLQPSDSLRQGTTSFLENLSIEEIEKLGLPQVWQTQEGLLISDGNHRTAILAKKGKKLVQIDYNKAEEYLYILNIVIERARKLREQGIFTVYDLWQA